MTLEERRVIWNKRKIEKRNRMIKKLAWKVGVVVLLAVGILVGILVFSNSAKAKEEKVYYKYYTAIEVMPGDTLTSIAKDHLEGYDSVSEYIEEVKYMNSIRNANSIRAGQIIHIPYYSTEIK